MKSKGKGRQEEFERKFRGLIERFRPALVQELRTLVATQPPPEVKILSFVIFSYWDQFPVRVFAMDDQSPDEVYFEPPFSAGVLEGAGELIPRGAIDQNAYEDAGVFTLETGARVLAEWVGECWHEAGGDEFALPAYIGHHDRSAQYDLRLKAWVDESDIWE
ncbi:hypothetical protein [Singulisphaera acidiphila]|uniref:Uncharacterized protein n=1 Tax=Singulisphaera acidiphila (strain ATCC BAA-1392 / DSM 18658 / VKM B-2454 / MOB10) TaxID=886293 RepID=L0DQ96_SINAD|nr:hypothetical protein [Singulisphaera acidiphila]AGA31569.1 hypothetical protein Sinac_7536 [Singulisphaera acidiphila DSM 18658]